MSSIKRGLTPRLWAGFKPFGIGDQRPNNFSEVLRAVYENRNQAGYAWRILNDGCCDGCALGTVGMADWTLDGIHLCNIRLRLLRLNTMPAFDIALLGDARALSRLRSTELREKGRLPYPMMRQAGEAGFRRISWEMALDRIAEVIQSGGPERSAFYLTSRGTANESYYGIQKAVRAMGINHIDNAARLCHSPSTTSLKESLGVAATTCSYSDWLESELIVFFGSNIATNQPVATKYLFYARKNGAQVALINPYREPGMEKYWIPSIPESALFGTKFAEHFYQVNIGGDIAFCNGVLKHMIANGWVDEAFVTNHTDGFDRVKAAVNEQTWEALEASSGTTREQMLDFARLVGNAKRAVFVWSMGITQHTNGEDMVQALVNVALARGFVGRTGCGLMPIRGHSGVQGGAEMGAYATVFPGGATVNAENAAALAEQWGFEVPNTPGMTSAEMIDAAHDGKLDLLFSVGGNFMEVLPDPDYVEEALRRVPLRVHYDITLTRQMMVEPPDGGAVILLPATTRYEMPGGVTETSTERRVIFSPEIPGPRIAEARPEVDAVYALARRVRPDHAEHFAPPSMAAIREEIGRVVPLYDGIQHLHQKGDQFQYGGPHLCADNQFETPNGRAQFRPVEPLGVQPVPEGAFRVTTRRGKQFNSMVHATKDAMTGALRESVLINESDAATLGIKNGDALRIHNAIGEMQGSALIAPVRAGNVEVHWPEGNVLLDHRCRSPHAEIPDYNGVVWIERL